MELSSNEGAALDEHKILRFPQGIPGFDGLSSFTLVHEAGRETPMVYALLSTDDPTVQLPVATADALGVNYEITLSDEECELLQLEDAAQVAVLLILFRSPDGDTEDTPGDQDRSAIRAGFMSPLIINTEHRIGLQKILNRVERRVTIQAS
jgi:flagellar assembly factor FliW